MYIKQKLLIGLCILFVSLSLINLWPKKAFADVAASDIRTATYSFRDGSVIVGDFGSSGKVTFIDSNYSDSTRNFEPPEGLFCDPGTIPDQGGVDGGIKFGINISSNAKLNVDPIPASSVSIKLGYNSGTVCRGILQSTKIDNPSAAATTDFKWSGTTIVSLEGQNNSDTFQLGDNIKPPYTNRLYISSNDSKCGANGAILLDAPGGNTGTYWSFSDAGRGGSNLFSGDYKTLVDTDAFDASCHVDSKARVTIAGTKGTAVDSDASSNAGDSCEQSTDSPFGWIACPILLALENFTNTIVDKFEGQLSFTISQDLGDKNSQAGVKKSWDIIKNISTVALVIVMLIMIFSQAIGGGPFDAYTVRKLLPRLVIAVILMQLSWVLIVWVVDLFDDIGGSLETLLFAPFGGTRQFALGALLQHAKIGTGSAAAIDTVALVGAIGLTAAALPTVLLFMFTAAMALLVGFLTLVLRKIIIIMLLILAPLALLAWILPGTQRYWKLWSDNLLKVLLMYPIVVAMVASGRIFAYIVGTQNNFKLLSVLFVLVGFFGPLFLLPKAFRWGGGMMKTTGDYIDRGSTKLGERPKKYFQARQQDWTDQRRRKSVERVAAGEGFGKDPRSWYRAPLDRFRSGQYDPLKQVPGYSDIGKRSQEEYQRAGEEIQQKDIAAAQAKVVREAQGIRADGGDWDRYFHGVAEGWVANKDDKGNVIRDKDGNVVKSKTYDWKDKSGNKHSIDISGRSSTERIAARKQAATLGAQTNWRYLEDYYQRSQDPKSDMSRQERVEARKFFDDNVQTIISKMPHVYTGIGAAADSNAESIGGYHGVETEAILADLGKKIKEAKTPEQKKNAETSLLSYLHKVQEAATNPNIGIHPGTLKAVKGFLDSRPPEEGGGGEFLDEINNAEYDGRGKRTAPVLLPVDKIEFDGDVQDKIKAFRVSLADNIDAETGVYKEKDTPPPPPPPTTPPTTPPPPPPPTTPGTGGGPTTTPSGSSAGTAPTGAAAPTTLGRPAGESMTAESIAAAVARGVREANEADFQRTRSIFNSGSNAGGTFRQNSDGEIDVQHNDKPNNPDGGSPPDAPPEV